MRDRVNFDRRFDPRVRHTHLVIFKYNCSFKFKQNLPITYNDTVTTRIAGYEEQLALDTMSLAHPIILGMPLYQLHNSHIDYKNNTLTFNSESYRQHCDHYGKMIPLHSQDLDPTERNVSILRTQNDSEECQTSAPTATSMDIGIAPPMTDHQPRALIVTFADDGTTFLTADRQLQQCNQNPMTPERIALKKWGAHLTKQHPMGAVMEGRPQATVTVCQGRFVLLTTEKSMGVRIINNADGPLSPEIRSDLR
jgi:hypothetical protein